MRKSLTNGESYKEQIKIVYRTGDIDGITKSSQKVAALTRSGYVMTDTVIDDDEINYILEKQEAV